MGKKSEKGDIIASTKQYEKGISMRPEKGDNEAYHLFFLL
jgi:hypothetical protein